MPYKDVSELPENVTSKLPKKAQRMWMSTFNASFDKYGEDRARKIAWSSVKSKFKKVEGKWVAKASDFDTTDSVYYEFELEGKNITESLDEDVVYYDYVLSSTSKDGNNKNFSELFLKRAAELINEEGLVGYIPEGEEHGLFKRLKEEGKNAKEVEDTIQNLDSGVKAIKAVYQNNKLHTTIAVKKDKVPMVDQFNGISVEAWIPKGCEVNDTYLQGKFVGFAFTNKPSNPDAVRVSA